MPRFAASLKQQLTDIPLYAHGVEVFLVGIAWSD